VKFFTHLLFFGIFLTAFVFAQARINPPVNFPPPPSPSITPSGAINKCVGEQVVLTVSKTGYAKTQPLSDYAAQRRGGRGKSATSMKEDDYIQHLIVTSNHATVLCFTNVGKVYRLRVFEVPQQKDFLFLLLI
jgi:hypothetical protein